MTEPSSADVTASTRGSAPASHVDVIQEKYEIVDSGLPKPAYDSREAVSSMPLDKLVDQLQTLEQKNMNLLKNKQEMEKVVKMFMQTNSKKLKNNLDQIVAPWVNSLEITEEEKAIFIKSIEDALVNGQEQGVSFFENNPVYTVACAASQCHMKLTERTQELEKKLEAATQQNMMNMKESEKERLMHVSAGSDCISLGKRGNMDISAAEVDIDKSCWGNVFENMTNSRAVR